MKPKANMNTALILSLPVIASVVAMVIAAQRLKAQAAGPIPTSLVVKRVAVAYVQTHVVAALLFGTYIAANVACCSKEPSMWLMPLIFAPLEYGVKFGLAIMAAAGVTAAALRLRIKRG